MALYERLSQQQRLTRVPVQRDAHIVTYYAALCRQRRSLWAWSMFFIWNFILFFWAVMRSVLP